MGGRREPVDAEVRVDEGGTWTSMHRGPDDAAIIGAFGKEAATAAGAGWAPISQRWEMDQDARVLIVSYARSAPAATEPGPAATEPGPAATEPGPAAPWAATGRAPEPHTAPAPRPAPVSPGHATPPPARSAPPQAAPRRWRDVPPDPIRGLLAVLGGAMAIIGATVVIGAADAPTRNAAGGTMLVGLAVWSFSRIMLGAARRRAGLPTALGSPASLVALTVLSLGLSAGAINRFDVASSTGSLPSSDAGPDIAFPTLDFGSIDLSFGPDLIDGFGIDDPVDGSVYDSPSAVIDGHAPASARITCGMAHALYHADADQNGQWSVELALDAGANEVHCTNDRTTDAAVITLTFSLDARADGTYSLGGTDDPLELTYGPLQLPAGPIDVRWTLDGEPSCAATFTLVPDAGLGFAGASFAVTADADGTADETRTISLPGTSSYRVRVRDECLDWTLDVGSSSP